MRRYHKQIVLDVLKSMYESGKQGDYANCQDLALSLCDFIDEQLGTGSEIVELLMVYAEMCFKANSGETSNKYLEKYLIKVENIVKFDTPISKIEVVFLSYKASMSDSIESIYLEAKKDPMCNAIFMPIPYYDRLPNGELGQMNYEGEDFYDTTKINITDYKDYNIELQRPDVIINFNPYDENNRVTSIHPDYYFSNLKKHTDLLIYCPYFIDGDNMKDVFTQNCGTIISHKTILWSDTSKKQHLDTFTNLLKSNDNDDLTNEQIEELNNKFIVLGSPKIDKVVNSTKTEFELPKEWENIIGRNKSIILFNTSIGGMLEHGDTYIKKLKNILQTFKNSKDIVLWWRPHPLIGTTYKSMRVHLLQEYTQILNAYREDGWGILDESAQPHRALAYADGYYGDSGSSLQYMYIVKGKPIMCINFQIENHLHTNIDFCQFDLNKEQNMKICEDVFLNESTNFTLEDFIKYVLNQKKSSNKVSEKQIQLFSETYKNTDGTAGKHIYNFIKKGCL